MRQNLINFISFSSVIFLIFFGYASLNQSFDVQFIITNLLINSFLIFKLFLVNKNISIINIIYIFFLFFFGISPIYQINNKFYTWGVYLTSNEVFLSNLTLIFVLITLQFIESKIKYNFKNNNNGLVKFSNEISFSINFKSQLFLLFFSFLLFIYFFYSYNFNFINILYRINDSDLGFRGNATFYLFISYFIRPLIFNIFLFYLFCKNKNKIIFSILFLIAILSVFPTGVPRFFAAAMYLTFFYILTLKMFKINISLLFVLMIGLIFIFPFLDLFRWFTSGENILAYSFNLDLSSGNFDAFGMFTLALNRGTLVYGSNILTVILFFVPRVFWPNKEIGSGAKISGELNLTLDNISMPYFAEGYLGFGIVGLLLFTLLISFLAFKIDFAFYNKMTSIKFLTNPIFLISYFNLVFLFFFIMRGDLLSSYAYLFGISFSNYFLFRVTKKLI